jgi:hypothetical protein
MGIIIGCKCMGESASQCVGTVQTNPGEEQIREKELQMQDEDYRDPSFGRE